MHPLYHINDHIFTCIHHTNNDNSTQVVVNNSDLVDSLAIIMEMGSLSNGNCNGCSVTEVLQRKFCNGCLNRMNLACCCVLFLVNDLSWEKDYWKRQYINDYSLVTFVELLLLLLLLLIITINNHCLIMICFLIFISFANTIVTHYHVS